MYAIKHVQINKLSVSTFKLRKGFDIMLPLVVCFASSSANGTIYPTPPLGQDMTQGQFLSGV